MEPSPDGPCAREPRELRDRKSTRLNSSHVAISYAVFCSKKSTIPLRSIRTAVGSDVAPKSLCVVLSLVTTKSYGKSYVFLKRLKYSISFGLSTGHPSAMP